MYTLKSYVYKNRQAEKRILREVQEIWTDKKTNEADKKNESREISGRQNS